MAKSLNDILNGVKKSKVEAGTTGDDPGVDYAEKMKDGRDFVAQHKVEKHEDRVGNDDEVYKASKVKKASMERHGHDPDPKAKKVYAAANEEVEQIDELSKEKLDGVKKEVTRRKENAQAALDDGHKSTVLPKFIKQYDNILGKINKKTQTESKMACEACGEEPCGCGGMKKGGKKVLAEKKPKAKTVHESAIMKAVEMVQRSKASELLDEDTVKSQLRDLSAKAMEVVLSSSDDFINESYVQHKIAQANKAIEDIHELMNYKNKV